MTEIINLLISKSVSKLFAYNAAFDKRHLPELEAFEWYDIMQIAADRQFNTKIPSNAECSKKGKLKKGYGVEPIMRMLSGNNNYFETHNALKDATDELEIMALLGLSLDSYDSSRIKKATKDLQNSVETDVPQENSEVPEIPVTKIEHYITKHDPTEDETCKAEEHMNSPKSTTTVPKEKKSFLAKIFSFLK